MSANVGVEVRATSSTGATVIGCAEILSAKSNSITVRAIRYSGVSLALWGIVGCSSCGTTGAFSSRERASASWFREPFL
jgi:hypothetical protein